jgi:broad specificity phosphatase PhoE
MATQPTIIHLIRHGEVHNPHKVLYGRLPRFRLTANGRRQARAASRLLGNQRLDAIYSSPLLRARQTAREILSGRNQSKLHISALLNEVCTVYEGLPGSQIDARNGDIYTDAPACFEQPDDVVARTRRFIGRMRRRYPGGRIAAVTHGDVITFTVLWAKGMAAIPKNKTRLLKAGYPVSYPAHASISRLTYRTGDENERPVIEYIGP